jgi:hypothetical protein
VAARATAARPRRGAGDRLRRRHGRAAHLAALPGTAIRAHFFWRYSIVWDKR